MPKQVKRNNPGGTRMGDRSVRKSRTPESVKALLSRSSHSALGRVADQRRTQADWREWLKNRLPHDISAHVTGAVERDGTLTIFADSSAWSARLRFCIAEFDAAIREANPAIRRVTFKVMPKSASGRP